MRLRRAGMRPFALPLARPLGTAHGPIQTRRGWLVRLEDPAGFFGLGEATPLPEFGTEGPKTCESALAAGLEALVSSPSSSFEESLARVAQVCGAAACAAAGLDSALHDCAARREGLALAAWLRRRAGLPDEPASSIAVAALVGGATPEAVADSALTARRDGFGTYKLKLVVSPEHRELDLDLERVVALRKSVGPTARIRLDANEAWSRSEAEAALAALEPFDIDYVEQPVARGDLDGLAMLAARSPIAVAADEALLGDGLDACLARGAASILVLKPAALGGIGPAARLVQRARAGGLRIVWSTLLDGAVSRAAAWHLAAGLSESEEAHGLATGSWLAADLASTPAICGGRLASGPGPGLGLEVNSGAAGEGEPWLGPMRCFEVAS